MEVWGQLVGDDFLFIMKVRIELELSDLLASTFPKWDDSSALHSFLLSNTILLHGPHILLTWVVISIVLFGVLLSDAAMDICVQICVWLMS